MSNSKTELLKFHSRYSMAKSQPYVSQSEFEQGRFSNIPGTQWIPDFSQIALNSPYQPFEKKLKHYEKNDTRCSTCKKYETGCGYQFWKTKLR